MNIYALLLLVSSLIIPLHAMEKTRKASQADLESRDRSAKQARSMACIDLTGEIEDVKPAIAGDLPALSLLSDKQTASPVMQKIDTFCTEILFKSLESGDAQAVAALIPFYCIDCTLLHAAIQRGDVRMAQLLIESLEKPLLNGKNKDGKTALMLCAKKELVPLITLLLTKGADHSIKDSDGKTFIQYLPTHLQALIQVVISLNEKK